MKAKIKYLKKQCIEFIKTARLRRFSLKWKWTLGATLGILITFLLFALILFQSFRSTMMRESETDVKDTISLVKDRLKNEKEPLISSTVENRIRPNYVMSGSMPNKPSTDDAKSNIYNDAITEKISKEGVSVVIYNIEGFAIFENRTTPLTFKRSSEYSVKRRVQGSFDGLEGASPIRSDENGNIIGYVQVTNSLRDFHRSENELIVKFIFVGIFATIMSAMIGYALAYYFLKPIRLMTSTIDEINSDPQSQLRIEIPNRNDELSDLTNIFNDMLDRMQRHIEQQKQFVEDVSHELRTPVAIIEGHLKLLNRWGKDDPEVLAESLEASLTEITRMKSLVQEMLDLSRAEQVEIHYINELTAVKQVVHQTLNNFKMIHPDFLFTLDDDLYQEVEIQIYRNHFEQILIILLDNAVKYSTNRPEINLSVSQNTQEIEIAIQDFGEGISEEDLGKIFNRFYRVDKARSRFKGGNGLGLAIAYQLVEGYHGTIRVDSVLEHGTIFRIRFPLIKAKKNAKKS